MKPWTGPATLPLALPDLDGRTIDLRALRGRVVVVNFWATWCEPCREEMPSLERLREKVRGKPVEVITVNYGEGPARIRDYLQRQGIRLPVLLDPDKQAAMAWRAGGLPITYLVDPQGRVRHYAFGERDWSEPESLRLVENLLEGAGRARR